MGFVVLKHVEQSIVFYCFFVFCGRNVFFEAANDVRLVIG